MNFKTVPPASVQVYHENQQLSDTFVVQIDQPYVFTCMVTGSKPATTITWYLGNTVLSGSQTDSPNVDDSRLTDSNKTIGSVQVSANAIIRCVVTVPGYLEISNDVNLIIGWYRSKIISQYYFLESNTI